MSYFTATCNFFNINRKVYKQKNPTKMEGFIIIMKGLTS
jgi:hypothetical protein